MEDMVVAAVGTGFSMAIRSPDCSTTQTISPLRFGSAQMAQGSVSEKVKQQEQSLIAPCRAVSDAASSIACEAGAEGY